MAKVSPDGKVRLFQYKEDVNPAGIVAATDGGAWFFDGGTGRIGRLTPGGKTTFFTPSPDLFGDISPPYDLVPGVSGDVWFSGEGEVGHIDSGGNFKYYALDDFASGSPQEFVVDPDGTAWFLTGGEISLGTDAPAMIGRIGTNGQLQNVPLGNVEATLISSDPGGGLNFFGGEVEGDTQVGVVGGLTPDGKVSAIPVDFNATQMLTGRDGSLWIDTSDGTLVHVTKELGPQVVGNSVFSSVVTQASDGSIWFATTDANPLGRIGATGDLSEYSVPVDPQDPAIESIVSDDAGNLWGVSGQSVDVPGIIVFHINVNNSLLTSATAAGVSAGPATQVATFVAGNAAAGDFSANVKWPDGTDTVGTIRSLGSGEFGVTSAAGHAMADGSAVVKIIDRRHGRTATASVPVVGNLPIPTGTVPVVQATLGLPFTATMADFSNVLPGELSQYSVGIDWDSNPVTGIPTGISNSDPKLTADGHGGLQVVASHMFVAPGTVPVAVTLGSMSNGVINSASVTCMVSVAPDANPHDMLVNASTDFLPGREGKPTPLSLGGASDVSKLTGAGGGVASITGRIQPQDFGAGSGEITFTDTVGSVTLNLRGKRAKNIFAVTMPWTYRLASATGAYAGLKKLGGRVDLAFGSQATGYYFMFHV